MSFAGIVAAEKLGVAHARIAICAPGAEANIRSLAAPSLDAHRHKFGLTPDPAGEHMAREPALTLFPASFEAAELGSSQVFSYRAPRGSAPALPNWCVLGDVPPNVHVERFVPQDDVIPHAAVVLCHAGSGTVLGALAAGIPIVATPLFADQPHNAMRIAVVGAGLAMPTATANAGELRAALTPVLQEDSFRAAAQRIAKDIAALPLLDDAALEIERLAAVRR